MASVTISEAEKTFVVHGVQEDLRADGRCRRDVRPASIETDLVTHASGSAHLRLANTDVLVGVKAELDTPSDDGGGDRGRLEFFVDCSANATPEFEGRGGESLATDLSSTLARAYNTFDLTDLCVLKGHQCWVLYVDILILECGGNLFDAISMAVKAALYTTLIPKVSVTAVDGGEPELELSDDPSDGKRLPDLLNRAPVLLTLNRIGNHCVVDASPEEEACSSAFLVVGVSPKGQITTLKKMGSGSFHPATIKESLNTGVEIAQEMHDALKAKLLQEEKLGSKRQKFGFLK